MPEEYQWRGAAKDGECETREAVSCPTSTIPEGKVQRALPARQAHSDAARHQLPSPEEPGEGSTETRASVVSSADTTEHATGPTSHVRLRPGCRAAECL
jgi:hypothetical protein